MAVELVVEFIKNVIEVLIPSGIDGPTFVAYFLIGILGIAASILHEVFRKREKIKEAGGFKLGVLWSDNKLRIAFSLVFVLVGIIIGGELGFIVNKAFSFLAGFATDKFIETLSVDKLRNKQ